MYSYEISPWSHASHQDAASCSGSAGRAAASTQNEPKAASANAGCGRGGTVHNHITKSGDKPVGGRGN